MKFITVLVIILVAILIVTLSLTLPILFRPFYYAQIDSLGLTDENLFTKRQVEYWESVESDFAQSSMTEEEIRQAYDEVMDYCLGFSSEFSAGILPYSTSGAEHFADVRSLFILDFVLIFVSAAGLVAIFVVTKKKKLKLLRFRKRSAPFWSVVSLGALSSVIGIACAINFKATFIFFHYLAFPGKSNWYFDPYTDPVIDLLPNQFFSNCAILIFGCMLIFCGGILLYEFLPRKKKKTEII